MPPCGGAPYSSASSRNPKRRLASSSLNPSAAEDLRLHVAAMNTNGARAEFDAVQHHVVGFGAAARGIGGQLFQILVMNRSEGMMGGVPAVLFVVPFEHREIHHPEELEILGVEELVPVIIFLGGVQAKLSASLIERLFGTLAFGARRPTGEQQQIVFSCAPRHARACSGEASDPASSDRRRRAGRARCRTPSARRAPCGSARRSWECGSPPAGNVRPSRGQQTRRQGHGRAASGRSGLSLP